TSSETGAKITLDVNTLSSGKIQFCMLGNCQGYSESGTYTKQGVLTASCQDDLMLDWLPASYGESTVTIRADKVSYSVSENEFGVSQTTYGDILASGPSITIKFVYEDAAAIKKITYNDKSASIYSINGQAVNMPAKGVNLMKRADGMMIKVYNNH
ncbi:MAG: hypothetical protein K6E54_06940, partial [Bacteroidaceae bacterium]|nr:hypothetical protein [Bacteroidaceae bacterium]